MGADPIGGVPSGQESRTGWSNRPARGKVGRTAREEYVASFGRLTASIVVALAAAASLAATPAAAQTFPNHPVRLVLGFAPGGNTDLIARIVADRVGGILGQRVIVERS